MILPTLKIKQSASSDATAFDNKHVTRYRKLYSLLSIKGNMGFSSDLAGKTGTSENEIDNWFVAYTPNAVTSGSWIDK